MEHKYWIDDDGYIANETGDVYETVSGQISKKHIEPLSRILDSQPELLETAKNLVKHLLGMENGKWLNNRPGDLLIRAIARADMKKKKFNVTITMTTIQTYDTSVDADDEEQAEDIVREAFENGDCLPDGWELDMEDDGVEFDVEPA
jgi:hypothetical protein